MSYTEIGQCAIAISTSESPDMPMLGLSNEHLRDAMVEISRHLLALGTRLFYGGDLRPNGFSELLFELVARHRRNADDGDFRTGVINYLAWPVHIQMTSMELERMSTDLLGAAELTCLALDGMKQPVEVRAQLPNHQPSNDEWSIGLTAMRKAMLKETDARIVLGGRTEQYKGVVPGIAEEALLSLQARQPLFVIGGFGGCARDLAETLKLADPWTTYHTAPGLVEMLLKHLILKV